MVKANFKQALKDYKIRWYQSQPLRCNYKDVDEFTICEFLWKLDHMSLGERLEFIKANLELSKNCQE